MRYLLDTHTLIWFLQDARELPSSVAKRIETDGAENHVSIASIWEMAIKLSLGKLRVPYSLNEDLPRLLEQNAFRILPLAFSHLQVLSELPFHHRDPFDRTLVAQAQVEGLLLLSRDEAFDAYGVQRAWA
jgi:PIN domain nuclease of toxin-antitoxin system